MYFGYGAPTRPPLGTAANTRKIAAKAEEVGLNYVSIADHANKSVRRSVFRQANRRPLPSPLS